MIIRLYMRKKFNGGIGVMVSTEVCGTSSAGSNPVYHPNFVLKPKKRGSKKPC